MRRGFSLFELIIVIAIIALLGGLVVVNTEGMLRGLGQEPVDRIFQKAVREARYQAASIKEPTYLMYDKDSGLLKVLSPEGQTLAEFNAAEESSKEMPDVQFEQILPQLGLDGSNSEETYPIQQVVFRPDRSSTPFRVIISIRGDTFTIGYDPFSAIVINDSRTAT